MTHQDTERERENRTRRRAPHDFTNRGPVANMQCPQFVNQQEHQTGPQQHSSVDFHVFNNPTRLLGRIPGIRRNTHRQPMSASGLAFWVSQVQRPRVHPAVRVPVPVAAPVHAQ